MFNLVDSYFLGPWHRYRVFSLSISDFQYFLLAPFMHLIESLPLAPLTLLSLINKTRYQCKRNFQNRSWSQKGFKKVVKEKLTIILLRKCNEEGMPKWVGYNCSFNPVVLFEWRKEPLFWTICTTHMILSLPLSLCKRSHYEAFKIVDTRYSLTHSPHLPL